MKSVLAALALFALAAPTAQALAQPADPAALHGPMLDISAYGEIKAAPDMARITLGVTNQASSAADAAQANAQQINQVLAALRGLGATDRDIQTSGLSLNPAYAYLNNEPPKLTGYKASNIVTVTVGDLAKLGPIVDAISQAGANEINGIVFTLKDPQAAEDEARRRAIKALAAKAALYAEATGYRVSRLITLREGGEPGPAPSLQIAAVAARTFAPTPVQPGELDIRVQVSGAYELAK
jgi:hypothetical protein